jgi:hypothetical protein
MQLMVRAGFATFQTIAESYINVPSDFFDETLYSHSFPPGIEFAGQGFCTSNVRGNRGGQRIRG